MPRREQTAPKLEDETLIRRYMLGEVSEDERTSIEKRLAKQLDVDWAAYDREASSK